MKNTGAHVWYGKLQSVRPDGELQPCQHEHESEIANERLNLLWQKSVWLDKVADQPLRDIYFHFTTSIILQINCVAARLILLNIIISNVTIIRYWSFLKFGCWMISVHALWSGCNECRWHQFHLVLALKVCLTSLRLFVNKIESWWQIMQICTAAALNQNGCMLAFSFTLFERKMNLDVNITCWSKVSTNKS